VAERPEPSIGGCVKLDKETNRGVYPLVNTLRLLLASHKTTRYVLGAFLESSLFWLWEELKGKGWKFRFYPASDIPLTLRVRLYLDIGVIRRANGDPWSTLWDVVEHCIEEYCQVLNSSEV